MRKFSSYGPVDKDIHFYVPREKLVESACRHLRGEVPEKGGHYITVWAPRQCGKTWLMREALWRLEEDDRFFVAKINLEITKNEKDPLEVVRVIVEELQKAEVLKNENIRSFNQFSSIFENERLEKPLILILDEFDSLDGSVISDLVGVFRNIFIGRTEDKADAFHKRYLLHGMALVGVRSVLGVENAKGSPFNVQRSIHIPNLTWEEVRSMFQWYEKESGQAVDRGVIERIYEETRGQPGLVSWLGELLTETFNREPDRPIGREEFEYAFRRAVNALPNNNIMNILSKAKRQPYRETVMKMFRTDRKIEFAFDDPHQNFLYMNGAVAFEEIDDKLYVKFSSPFVQKRLFNYFSREIYGTLDNLYDPMTDIEALVSETDVDVPAVMRLYQIYLNKNREWLLRDAPRRKTDLRIFEAVFHFNLYMYLKAFFQDIGGDVFPEFPTGNGKVDLMIRRAGKLYELELKCFKDRYAYKQALARGALYAQQLGVKTIFLVFFIESIDDENRLALEKEYRDDQSGATVLPLFVETGNVSG